jgi:hypothetical protein
MVVSVPVLLETEKVLGLWLGEVPDFAVGLTRLVLVLALVECFGITVSAGIQATGRIRGYQVMVGGVYLLNFPVAWGFYRAGAGPGAALGVSIVLGVVNLFVRLWFLRRFLGIGMWDYVRYVLGVSVVVMGVSCVLPVGLFVWLDEGFWRLLAVVAGSAVGSAGAVYGFGLRQGERRRVMVFVRGRLRRLCVCWCFFNLGVVCLWTGLSVM